MAPTPSPASTLSDAPSVWDAKTQEMHGGQTWRFCPHFRADFSVTTTPQPTPPAALRAAAAALDTSHHYPPADAHAARAALAALAGVDTSALAVGNGASEFIDLIMRLAPPGPFRPGPFVASYREYHRAARVAGRRVLPPSLCDEEGLPEEEDEEEEEEEEEAAITVVIRPNSPTGQLLSLDAVDRLVRASPNSLFVFDESFLPFAGADWNSLSAASLVPRYPDRVLVIHSWTKIWGCAGLRLGSLLGDAHWMTRVRAAQTPWSCSAPAQAFAVVAAADTAFLARTRADVAKWRLMTLERVRTLGWSVVPGSVDWAPWVFVQCPDPAVARRAIAVAQQAGCPIRPCDSYGLPDRLRIAVRQPEFQDVLFGALQRELGASGLKK